MIKIEAFILLEEFGTNTWLLWDDESLEAILVDPAAPSEDLLARIRALDLKVLYIINTHGHGDHIGGNELFRKRLQARLLIHAEDAHYLTDNRKNLSEYLGAPLNCLAADEFLHDGQSLNLGSHIVRVIHTPGHTPGGICLLADKFLISGDTLFELSIGRTDFPGGSHKQIIASIKEKLFILPDDVVVCPGHGPRTSIGMEKMNNPLVR